MTSVPPAPPALPQLLTRQQAAKAVALSLRSFERHVAPKLQLVRVGHSVRVPVSEIERWISEEMKRPVRS